jgi:hypothetical protein
MLERSKFKFICDACGSLTIQIANPEQAPDTTVVECGRCKAPRGTMAALRDLARKGNGESLEF